MRVLLDENIPHDLVPQFAGHDVSTVQGLAWAGLKNGDLLERARGTIDVFVTMDRKLEKQHDLAALPFGVVVIVARSNRMPDLFPLIDALRYAVARIVPGRSSTWGAAAMRNRLVKATPPGPSPICLRESGRFREYSGRSQPIAVDRVISRPSTPLRPQLARR